MRCACRPEHHACSYGFPAPERTRLPAGPQKATLQRSSSRGSGCAALRVLTCAREPVRRWGRRRIRTCCMEATTRTAAPVMGRGQARRSVAIHVTRCADVVVYLWASAGQQPASEQMRQVLHSDCMQHAQSTAACTRESIHACPCCPMLIPGPDLDCFLQRSAERVERWLLELHYGFTAHRVRHVWMCLCGIQAPLARLGAGAGA